MSLIIGRVDKRGHLYNLGRLYEVGRLDCFGHFNQAQIPSRFDT